METYNNPAEYKGKEWDELLRSMNVKDIRRVLKSTYRRVGKQIADIARADLVSSGLRNADKMKRAIRVHVYGRGGGFEITTKFHGKQGFYRRSQDGKEKPVVMWAQDGTSNRFTYYHKRVIPFGGGAYRTLATNARGSMRKYDFLRRAESQAPGIIENGLGPELEKAVNKRALKLGWT